VRFLAELKRRHVIRMAGLYLVSAWLVVQVAATLLPVFQAPEWVMRLLVWLLIAGFVPALVLSWFYQLTQRGLERESSAPEVAKTTSLNRRSSDRTRLLDERSIAVLPVQNIAEAGAGAAIAEGLHDDLLTQLAKVRALHVISRTSVNEYRDSHKSVQQIAGELNVATLLECGLQQAQDRIRINVKLIDARRDRVLWTESYDRALAGDSLLEVQSDIVQRIALALRAQLLPEEAAALARNLTQNTEALDAYRQARHWVTQFNGDSFVKAAPLIDRALALDPNFAAAYCLRARNMISKYWFSAPDAALLQEAKTALDQARALGPDMPELHLAEGYYCYYGYRQYELALASCELALRAAPNDAELHRLSGFIARRQGRWVESASALELAYSLDPRNALGRCELALTLLRMRDFEHAQEHADYTIALEPNWGFGRVAKAILLVERDRDYSGALALLQLADPGNSQPAYRRWWLLNALGRFSEALAVADFSPYARDRNYCWPASLTKGLSWLYAGEQISANASLQLAVQELQTRIAQEPDYEPAYIALCLAYGALKMPADIKRLEATVNAAGARDALKQDELRYLLASSYALAGENATALRMLQEQIAGPHHNGLAHIAKEPAFAALRASKPYQRWIKAVGKREGQSARGSDAPHSSFDRWLLAGLAAIAIAVSLRLLPSLDSKDEINPRAKTPALSAADSLDQQGSTAAAKQVAAQAAPDAAPAAPAALGKSIAVLPFANLSNSVDTAYFAEGLSEELLNALLRIPEIRVAGRASSFQFKQANPDLQEVGNKLKVAYVLEGSVRRSEARARITARLTRIADGAQLWSHSYDREINDVLDVQIDIATRVTEALDVLLDDATRARVQQLGMTNIDAFIAFQKGRKLYSDAHDPARSDNLIETLKRANVEFARTLELEPSFGPAYYLSTDLYHHQMMSDELSDVERQRAIADNKRELDLAARYSFDSVERTLVQVDAQLASNNWTGLDRIMTEAVQQQGHRQSNWLPIAAIFGLARQRFEAPEDLIARDPLSALGYYNLALAANWAELPDRALDAVQRGNAQMGGSPGLTLQGVRAALYLGNKTLARTWQERIPLHTANGAMARLLIAYADQEPIAKIEAELQAVRVPGWNPELWIVVDQLEDALLGRQEQSDIRARRLDQQPGGPLRLANLVRECQCGVPFSLDAAPNFDARLRESKLAWPPPNLLKKIRM
jgi:adenylate cyclase